jgi:hypothetical protein
MQRVTFTLLHVPAPAGCASWSIWKGAMLADVNARRER